VQVGRTRLKRAAQGIRLGDVTFLEEELNEVARGYKCRIEMVGDMVMTAGLSFSLCVLRRSRK